MTRTRPTETLARWAFALLVVATFAAFFVTQRLKHVPPVVLDPRMENFFSPYSLHHPVERISFKIKRADDVTVTVLDSRGRTVATLWRGYWPAYRKLSLSWNGYGPSGSLAPDGRYRVRVRLRRQARAVILTRSFVLRTVGPRPMITSIAGASGAPADGGPAILPQPGGGPLTISFTAGGGLTPKLAVYRTDVSPSQLVTPLAVKPGASSVTWDGTVRGQMVPPGTYMVTISAVDATGNPGSAPPVLPPAPVAGERVPGRPGITVRFAGVEPPSTAAVAGTDVTFGVDTRRLPYSWTIARVGADRPRARGRASTPLLKVAAPRGDSGAYVLAVGAGGHSARALFAVQGLYTQRVLVVLPVIAWLGENPGDDDGDGLPNTLVTGQSVRTQRILAGNGLPAEFGGQIEPLLAFLDHHQLRYDITTDLALAEGSGPPLATHAGVLLAGSERWVTPSLAGALRSYVEHGGRVASLGIDSLLRGVTLAPPLLRDPTAPAPVDVFGAQLAAPAANPGTITNFLDRIGLFQGGDGQFNGYDSYEATASVGAASELLSSAVTSAGRPVIVAVRRGRGLVIRTGLPALHLDDPTTAALMVRIWGLLSQ